MKLNIYYFKNSTRTKAAYEGDGKTKVRIINQELDLGLMIDTYATVSSFLLLF